MGKIIKKRIEYGGSSNSAENIKYDDTKNVKEAINEVKNSILDTMDEIKTNTQPNKSAGALAVKEWLESIVVLTGVLSSTTDMTRVHIPYPDGFTKDNTMILSVRIDLGQQDYYYYNPQTALLFQYILQQSDGIYITANSSYVGKVVSVIAMRTDML